jgi:four helix bundle protein
MAQSYTDLIVWKKSMDMVVAVYEITRHFPDSEKFGLVNQMRRAAVSIPSNIAEGFARKGDTEFVYFLKVAYGSSAELETQLILAERLKFTRAADFDKLTSELIEVRKMLASLIRKLRTTD